MKALATQLPATFQAGATAIAKALGKGRPGVFKQIKEAIVSTRKRLRERVLRDEIRAVTEKLGTGGTHKIFQGPSI